MEILFLSVALVLFLKETMLFLQLHQEENVYGEPSVSGRGRWGCASAALRIQAERKRRRFQQECAEQLRRNFVVFSQTLAARHRAVCDVTRCRRKSGSTLRNQFRVRLPELRQLESSNDRVGYHGIRHHFTVGCGVHGQPE